MAHSAGWVQMISYVWAITQGRKPVSFITVCIPFRGEWTLNEYKSINQSTPSEGTYRAVCMWFPIFTVHL
jgi:hypothetical protein